MNAGSARDRYRRLALSVFICFHVVAVVWWNYVGLRREPATRSDVARGTLSAYVHAAGLWQRWELFGPNAPHERGGFELYAVRSEPTGGHRLDTEPLYASDLDDLLDWRMLLGQPPCGFQAGDRPPERFLRSTYAQFRAREYRAATGDEPLGLELLCRIEPLPPPGQKELGPVRVWRLWSGFAAESRQ